MNESSSPLDDIINGAIRAAKYAMRNQGRVSPTCLLHTSVGLIAYCPETMGNEQAKDDFAKTARVIGVAYHATAIVMILESWIVLPKPGKELDPSIRPSESPDREECVFIVAENMTETRKVMLMIRRDWNGVFLCFERVDIPSIVEGVGRFAKMMPPKPPTEKDRETCRQLLKILGVSPDNLGFNPLWN